jgi:AsmA-like C-terminal region
MTEEPRRRRWLVPVFVAVLVVVGVVATVGVVMVRRAVPILKGRVIETLSTRFDSRVEMDGFQVSVLKGLEVTGDGLRIYAPDDVVAAGATTPLIAVRHFEFHTGMRGLFLKPMHVGTVQVAGLVVTIPPREQRQAGQKRVAPAHRGKLKIFVDEINCDDSHLILETLKPGKDPKDFELQHIELHDVGPTAPWQYVASIVNAIPKGEVHATGNFGPWDTESPGDSLLTGHYTFDKADLNTIRGIGGMLTSVGDFSGQLNRIVVEGTTGTPDFSIDTANHPMPLETKFHATVDGTTGDTYLEQVLARLGGTEMKASGEIVNVKGKGHIIDMAVDVPGGRIQDLLQLGIKTKPVIMTGVVGMKARLYVPPGEEGVAKKMGIKATYTLRKMHFTNPAWQDKVDMMSMRAQGHPKDAKPGVDDVASEMKGQFSMENGRVNFQKLDYTLPGGEVRLEGVYSLDGREFDFHGEVQTDAKLSQMVASRWKSWLLKPVDPFFTKNGRGAQIPIKITGTGTEPKFGLDLHHKDK